MNEIVNTFFLAGDKFMPKQRKNAKIYADKKYKLYLQKWSS